MKQSSFSHHLDDATNQSVSKYHNPNSPSLLFIHGFRGSSLGLQPLIQYFNPTQYQVYAPDLPPAGGQDLPAYDVQHCVEFLKTYIIQHHLHRPILIGHSLGSIIAAAFAAKYPQLCHQAIFFLAPISVKPSKFYAALTPLTIVLPNHLVSYMTTKYLFIPHNKILFHQTLQLTYQCGADYTSKKSVYLAGKFAAHHCISDFVFHKDAYFISGESDHLIPLAQTTLLAHQLHATTAIIPQAGHLLNYERPQFVAQTIQNFLQSRDDLSL